MDRELRFPAGDLIVDEAAFNAFVQLRDAVRYGADEVSDAIAATVDAIAMAWPTADSTALETMHLNALVQRAHEAGEVGDTLAAAAAKLTTVVVGPWITRILEVNFAPGEPMHPALESFRAMLKVAVEPDDPAATEKLYRRWLAGLAPTDLPWETLSAFASRWSTAERPPT